MEKEKEKETITLTKIQRSENQTIYQIRIDGMLDNSYEELENAENRFNELVISRKDFPKETILKTEIITKNN